MVCESSAPNKPDEGVTPSQGILSVSDQDKVPLPVFLTINVWLAKTSPTTPSKVMAVGET